METFEGGAAGLVKWGCGGGPRSRSGRCADASAHLDELDPDDRDDPLVELLERLGDIAILAERWGRRCGVPADGRLLTEVGQP
jgi:hypothetical protein